MNITFYLCSAIAIVATTAVIASRNAVHALLCLVVSLLAIAGVFVTLGAPFVAALEVIVYAGAIMVLFVFVVVLLNVTPQVLQRESAWLRPREWIAPAAMGAILLAGLASAVGTHETLLSGKPVGPQAVGVALFSTYILGVEMASMLLLAGLVAAYHLGRRSSSEEEKQEQARTTRPLVRQTVPDKASPDAGKGSVADTRTAQEVETGVR